ncbi:MAG TPA: alpha/beta hydrolase [Rhizomicrobium sp.]
MLTCTRFTWLVLAILSGCLLFSVGAVARLDTDLRCHLGAYELADGRFLTVEGYEDSARDLAYLFSSGAYGRLAAAANGTYAPTNAAGQTYGSVSFAPCSDGKVTFAETGAPVVEGRHVALRITETDFDSAGTRLHGKLVLPANGVAKAIVVWIQGSEDTAETDSIFWQYALPLQGVGVFVYDKRGTGLSAGEATADFYVRAGDTAAAVRRARELAPDVHRIGVFGGSQGGWIAPLTATKTDLDFVIVGYGLAEGVTAQDRDEVEEAVRAAGFGDDVMPKVREITHATARVATSYWKDGWDELAAVKRKYSGEPWYKAINGENGYTAILLRTPEAQAREMGPKLDRHVSFGYDPRPVIASISPRQLWVLGGADRTAPSRETIRIITEIQTNKPNLDLAIYRNADHGIAESFVSSGVARHRYPDGYIDLIAGWIKEDRLPAGNADLDIHRAGK